MVICFKGFVLFQSSSWSLGLSAVHRCKDKNYGALSNYRWQGQDMYVLNAPSEPAYQFKFDEEDNSQGFVQVMTDGEDESFEASPYICYEQENDEISMQYTLAQPQDLPELASRRFIIDMINKNEAVDLSPESPPYMPYEEENLETISHALPAQPTAVQPLAPDEPSIARRLMGLIASNSFIAFSTLVTGAATAVAVYRRDNASIMIPAASVGGAAASLMALGLFAKRCCLNPDQPVTAAPPGL